MSESLRDALASITPKRAGVACSTCLVRSEMNEEDRQAFDEMLLNRRLSGPTIRAACLAVGYELTDGSLKRHRRGECSGLPY